MTVIGGTTLSMVRGDTETLIVRMPTRPPAEGDILELTVRRRAGSGPALIHKKLTAFPEGAGTFTFAPEDTEGLEFGTYSYDIQATFSDLGVKTLVKPSDFVLERENTYDG